MGYPEIDRARPGRPISRGRKRWLDRTWLGQGNRTDLGQVFWLRTVLRFAGTAKAKGVSPSRGKALPQWDLTRFPSITAARPRRIFTAFPSPGITDRSASRAGMDAARGQE
jgi:hypothetical protein